jgi:hypothetical protein
MDSSALQMYKTVETLHLLPVFRGWYSRAGQQAVFKPKANRLQTICKVSWVVVGDKMKGE